MNREKKSFLLKKLLSHSCNIIHNVQGIKGLSSSDQLLLQLGGHLTGAVDMGVGCRPLQSIMVQSTNSMT